MDVYQTKGLAKWVPRKLLKRKLNAGWGVEFQNGKSGGIPRRDKKSVEVIERKGVGCWPWCGRVRKSMKTGGFEDLTSRQSEIGVPSGGRVQRGRHLRMLSDIG